MAKKKTKAEENTEYDDIQAFVQTTKTALEPKFAAYNEIEDLYLSYTPKDKRGTAKSNIPDAMAFEAVESVSSHLFTNKIKGEYVPTEPSDTMNVEMMGLLADYQIERPAQNFDIKFLTAGKQMAMYGNAYMLMLQRYEVNKKGKLVWNDPCLHNLNVYDAYPDLGAASAFEMGQFVFDEYLTVEQLEAQNVEYSDGETKKKRYGDLSFLHEVEGNSKMASSFANTYRGNLLTNYKIDSQNRYEGRILVRRYLSLDRWVTILPDFGKTIESKPCPYEMDILPVIPFVDYLVPGSIIGMGEIEPVKGLMQAMNQLQAMRFDNVKMILERPISVLPSSFQYINSYVWGRNKIWKMTKEGDVRPMDIPDTTGSTYAQMNGAIEDKVSRRLGRTDFLSRTDSGQNKTAAEIKAMVGEQNARLRAKGVNVDMAIRRMYVILMKLNQQFMATDKALRIMGERTIQSLALRYGDRMQKITENIAFLNAKPEEIAGEFDYQIQTTAGGADTATEINAGMGAVKMLIENKQILNQEGIEVNLAPLIIDIISKLGVKNIDQIIKEIPYEQTQNIESTAGLQSGSFGQTGRQPGFSGMAGNYPPTGRVI